MQGRVHMVELVKLSCGGQTAFAVVWLDPEHGELERKFSSRAEAMLFAGSVESLGSNLRPTKPVLVSELCKKYLIESRAGRDGALPLAQATLVSYQHHFSKTIEPVVGSLRIDQIDRSLAREIQRAIIFRATSRDAASRAFNFLKTCFMWATTELGLVPNSPFEKMRIQTRRRGQPKRIKIHSEIEMSRIKSAAFDLYTSSNKRTREAWFTYYPMLLLLMGTGIRISECLGIQRRDFSENLKDLSICRSIEKNHGGRPKPLRVVDVKSGSSERTVPVPNSITPFLEDLLQAHSSVWVFPNGGGSFRDYDTVRQRMWNRLVSSAQVRHLGIHSLRHYYASELISAGFVKEAQRNLGHHSAAFTLDMYGHLIDDGGTRLRELANDVSSPF